MKKLLLVISWSFTIGFSSAQNYTLNIETAKEQAIEFSKHLQKTDFRATNPTGLLHLEFDTAATLYDTISRIIYGDYDDGIPTLHINQTYKNGVYSNAQKFKGFARIDTAAQLYEIDSLHIHTWDSATSAWTLSIRMLFAYKSPGNISTVTSYVNFSPFGWIKWAVTKYYYDSNDFNIAIINTAATFSGLNFVMVPIDSIAFTNDVNGNPTTEIQWNYADSVYTYDNKYLRIFDANDNNVVRTNQKWDTTGSVGVWKNNSLDSLTYDANGNETIDIQYTWNGTAWDIPIKYTTAYNSNKQVTQEMRYIWTSSAWKASYRKTYNFKGNGDHDFDLVERSLDGIAWIVGHTDAKDIYLYDITIEINQSEINADVFSVFPNPSNGKIVLKLGSSVNGKPVLITVFDITGRPVYNDRVSVTANTANLNLTNLDAGIYLLKLAQGNSMAVKRIIIVE